MGQRKRKVKAPKPECTEQQRERMAEKIRMQLQLLGLTRECQPINELHNKLTAFVESGVSESGRIRVPEVSRYIDYVFNNHPDPADAEQARGSVRIVCTSGAKKAEGYL